MIRLNLLYFVSYIEQAPPTFDLISVLPHLQTVNGESTDSAAAAAADCL